MRRTVILKILTLISILALCGFTGVATTRGSTAIDDPIGSWGGESIDNLWTVNTYACTDGMVFHYNQDQVSSQENPTNPGGPLFYSLEVSDSTIPLSPSYGHGVNGSTYWDIVPQSTSNSTQIGNTVIPYATSGQGGNFSVTAQRWDHSQQTAVEDPDGASDETNSTNDSDADQLPNTDGSFADDTITIAGSVDNCSIYPIFTAPVLSPAQPTAIVGSTGWYTGAPTLSLFPSDQKGSTISGTTYQIDSGPSTSYTGPITITSDGQHTIQYFSQDVGGNLEAMKAITVNVDQNPPSTNAIPALGSTAPSCSSASSGYTFGSWTNRAVAIALCPTDAGSGVAATYYKVDNAASYTQGTNPVIPAPDDHSNDGTHSVTFYSVDNVGHAETSTTAIVKIDTTVPTLSVPASITVPATSSSGAVASFAVSAADPDDSGLTPTCDHASGSVFPVGTTTVTCKVSDKAGNTAQKSFNVTVAYSWSNVLAPINTDGSSIFKLGRTVPIKFQLTGPSAGITDAVITLSLKNVSSSVTGTTVEATSTAASDTGNTFRYSSTDGTYIFNLGTKSLSTGAWQLVFSGVDASQYPPVIFSLR